MNGINIYEIISGVYAGLWMPLSLNIMIDNKIGRLRRIIFVLICMIEFTISQIICSNAWGVLILIIFIMVTMFLVLDRRIVLLLLVPVSYIIVLNSNYIVGSLYYSILGNDADINKMLGLPFYSAITLVVVLISLLIRGLIILARKKMAVYISKEMTIFSSFIIVVCSFVCIAINWSDSHASGSKVLYRYILFLCTIITGLILIGVFRVIYGKEIRKRKEEEHRNIMEYTKHVEEMYEELRSFRHDYVNILASLSGYIEKKDVDGLSQYFEENILPTNERMNQGKYRLQKLSKIKDPAIKGLVSNKIIYAMNQGIDVFVDLMDDIKEISINTIDLCRILGIYMDNAIEAAKECVDKEIKFNVVKEDNSVTFVLMNSFVNHGLSLTDMEKQNVSSKGEGRGLGLNNVNEILSRYDNINKVTEIKDNYFIQTLIIDDKAA